MVKLVYNALSLVISLCLVLSPNAYILTLEQLGAAKVAAPSFSILLQLPVRVFHYTSAYSESHQSVMKWRWDFRNSPTRYQITSPEVKVGWMIFWRKCDKLDDHWIIFWSKFNVAAFVFEDAEVTAADSDITLCTIRSEFNRKSKWRTWKRKHLNLTF